MMPREPHRAGETCAAPMVESFAASGDGWRISVHFTRDDMARMNDRQRDAIHDGIAAILRTLADLAGQP